MNWLKEWFNRKVALTPDGQRYVLAAEGKKLSRPFHYRWLLPKLLGPWPEKWVTLTDVCSLILPALAFWFAGGGKAGLFVAALTCGFTGIIHFNRKFPVLVDLPAMTVGLLSACCWHQHWYVLAVALVTVGACIKETTPVFAAAWAWTPWMLIGLAAPAVRHLMRRDETAVDADNEWHLREVVSSAFKYRSGWPTLIYILPWGAALVGLAHMNLQLAVVLALAYGQLLIATDVVRLYEWAFPTLAVAAAGAVSPGWFVPLALIHLVNPYRSEGS